MTIYDDGLYRKNDDGEINVWYFRCFWIYIHAQATRYTNVEKRRVYSVLLCCDGVLLVLT